MSDRPSPGYPHNSRETNWHTDVIDTAKSIYGKPDYAERASRQAYGSMMNEFRYRNLSDEPFESGGSGRLEANAAAVQAGGRRYVEGLMEMGKEKAALIQMAALLSWQAMYESCYNYGQQAILEQLRSEYITKYQEGMEEDYEAYMSWWRGRIDDVAGL